jgi:replicative DNA helicase
MATKVAPDIIPLDRVPPQNLEAERSVLGAMLLDDEAVGTVIEMLDEDAFYQESHRRIFRTVLSLFEKNRAVDMVTLVEELKKEGGSEAVGGASYIASLFEEVPTAANVEHYAEIVRDKGLLRNLIAACTRAITESYDEKEEVEILLDRVEKRIFDIAENRSSQAFVALRDLVMGTMERFDEIQKHKHGITGIPTGFRDLDTGLSGLQPSELIIVAARTSVGKTSLALNIAQHAAIKEDLCVGIFSVEMSKEQVVQRMLCSEGRVNWQHLRTGHLSAEDFGHLPHAADRLQRAPIFIDDTPAIPVLEVRAKARRLKANHDVQLLIVDYLQLMQGRGRVENRQQEVAEISRSLKALARELRVPVIAVSQLSREVDKRESQEPRLSDLRESGAIEQDADVVLLLSRKAMYSPDKENENKATLHIAKQRNGPTGRIPLIFIKEYARFENAETSREEPSLS